ncbi:hypothetical protein [Thermococcus aciditolerans]|uniref:Uncharacterized protein n=1 Tax=Thermococcus aciditolerans TaxID=2598455 RepID=A0A5C0SN99_9EURY|nr:hypothetical protein [Thermococcus aciditolerans]QEK15462.1 hypothetical protein FPV09_10600 [Thermococcus aciditolerans]
MEWMVYCSGNTITLMKVEAGSVGIISRNGFKLVEFKQQPEHIWTITVPQELNAEDILAELVIHKDVGKMGFSKNLAGEDRIIFMFAEEELPIILKKLFGVKCDINIDVNSMQLVPEAVV